MEPNEPDVFPDEVMIVSNRDPRSARQIGSISREGIVSRVEQNGSTVVGTVDAQGNVRSGLNSDNPPVAEVRFDSGHVLALPGSTFSYGRTERDGDIFDNTDTFFAHVYPDMRPDKTYLAGGAALLLLRR